MSIAPAASTATSRSPAPRRLTTRRTELPGSAASAAITSTSGARHAAAGTIRTTRAADTLHRTRGSATWTIATRDAAGRPVGPGRLVGSTRDHRPIAVQEHAQIDEDGGV